MSALAGTRPVSHLYEKIGLILVSGLLYGVTIASVDVAADFFPPVTLTALRLLAASSVWAAVLAFQRPAYRWTWRGAGELFVIGLFNVGLPFLSLALAVKFISSSLAAVLFNIQPVFTVLLAHLLLADEKLNLPKAIGMTVALSGATVLIVSRVSGLSAGSGQSWIGQLLILFASLCGALGVVGVRLRLRALHTTVLSAGQVFASLLIFLPLAFAREGFPVLAGYPLQAWATMLAAAICAPVLAYWLMFYMVNKYSASLAGFASIATPLFSVLIGLIFLGEVISLPIIAGAVLLLAGVWWLQYF